jgi:hypothetical protein
MLVSQLAPAQGYPHVQHFLQQVLDMQFGDVRAMLQLPRPEIGITPGCNFAIVSSLCNLISGVSTTIYKPPELLTQVRSNCGAGHAFRSIVRDFFPYTPPGANSFPEQLYQLCRNPMAHSVGLMDAPAPVVLFSRALDAAHPERGWSDRELEDLERPDTSFSFPYPGIVVDVQRWTLHCDSFYLDVIDMLRRLNVDPTQMRAAEARFAQGVHNWRR